MIPDLVLSRTLPSEDTSCLAWAEDGLLAFNKGPAISIMRPSLKSIVTAKAKDWFIIDTPPLDSIEGKFTWLDGIPNPYGLSVGETAYEELSVGLAWSPIGAGPEKSCLLAVVTNMHRVYVFSAGPTYESGYVLKHQITTLLGSLLGLDDGAFIENEISLRKLRTMSLSWSKACILDNHDVRHVLALGHQASFVSLWSVLDDNATMVCELNIAELLGEDNLSNDGWIDFIKWGPWLPSGDRTQFKSFLALSTSEGRVILVSVTLAASSERSDGMTLTFGKALECIPANSFLPTCLEACQRHVSGSCIFALCQTCKVTILFADAETDTIRNQISVECDKLIGSISGLTFASSSIDPKSLSVYVLSNDGAGAEIVIDLQNGNGDFCAILKDSNEAYTMNDHSEDSYSSKLVVDLMVKKSEHAKLRQMNIVDTLVFGMTACPSVTSADPCLLVYAYMTQDKESLHYPLHSKGRVHFAFVSLLCVENLDEVAATDEKSQLDANEWPIPLPTFGPELSQSHSGSLGLYQTHILLREPEWRLLRTSLTSRHVDLSQSLIGKPRRLRPIAALHHYCKRLIDTLLPAAIDEEDLQSTCRKCREALIEIASEDDSVRRKKLENCLRNYLYESRLASLLRYILEYHLLIFNDYLTRLSSSGEQGPADAASFLGEDVGSVKRTEPERAEIMSDIYKQYLDIYNDFNISLQRVRRLTMLRLAVFSAAIVLQVEQIYKESGTNPDTKEKMEKWVCLFFSGLSCQVLSGYISILVHLDAQESNTQEPANDDDGKLFSDSLYNKIISTITKQSGMEPRELGIRALKFLVQLRESFTGLPVYDFSDLNDFLVTNHQEMKKAPEFEERGTTTTTTSQIHSLLTEGSTLEPVKLDTFDRAIIHVHDEKYQWLRCCLTLLPIIDIGAQIAFDQSVSVLFPYDDSEPRNNTSFFSLLWSTCSQICIFTGLPYKKIN